jgi:hypothetical protein
MSTHFEPELTYEARAAKWQAEAKLKALLLEHPYLQRCRLLYDPRQDGDWKAAYSALLKFHKETQRKQRIRAMALDLIAGSMEK